MITIFANPMQCKIPLCDAEVEIEDNVHTKIQDGITNINNGKSPPFKVLAAKA